MNKTTKAISTITILLLIAKPLGFLREMIIAAYYGASWQTDAYNMAIRIIELSTIITTAGISTVIIPMYNHRKVQKNKDEADLFVNNILCIASLFCAVVSIIGIVFAPVLITIFAPNFNGETAVLTIKIIRIMFIFTVVTNISSFMMAMAKVNNKFVATVIVSYPASMITIVFTIFFVQYIGIYSLVISYILFLLIQMLILIFSLRKVFNLKFSINFISNDLIEVVKLSIPIYLGVIGWEIGAIIERILASGLPEGSISAMTYASKLRSLPDSIITASILTVIFPLLSQYAAKKDFFNLKASTVKAISLLFVALMPVIAISIYYSGEITKIIYERGAFTSDNTALTANIFIYAIISLIFSGGANLLVNAFYSIQNTKTPQIAGFIAVGCNIILNLILVRYMQATGLVLANSIAIFANFMLLFIQFRRKFGAFGGLSLVKNIAKCVIATASMIPIFFLCELLRDKLHLFFFFSVSVAVSVCIYVLLLYIFKVELFMEALKRGKSFLKSHLKNSSKR